jgi:WD40 repeat protein
MIEARSGHTATLLHDGTVLVAGGYGPASAELYDPSSGQWTATGAMIEARDGHSATPLPDGRVLVAGGSSGPAPLASAELYDPGSGTWTATGNMIEGRVNHTATRLPDGKVLVAGGGGSGTLMGPAPLASAELYDPSSGSWTAAANMNEVRSGHTATVLPDGRVLVAGGGSGPASLASAELYDPSSGSWTAAANMLESRSSHTATLLPNGTVLVAGGLSGSTSSALHVLASAELYDPSGGSWTASGNMIEARYEHTATLLLLDGRVLVTGGISSISRGYNPLASAELYDPSPGSWTATGSMAAGRRFQTDTLLRDGTVLVAGGGSDSGALASAELYDPGSGT